MPHDSFDLAAAIEVIEHVADYPALLAELARVAPRAIITTPNKNRSAFDSVASTPMFSEHVREWTAGEFYWVLRVFWATVELMTIDDFRRQVAAYRRNADHHPAVRHAALTEREPPLLAYCSRPHGFITDPGASSV